MAISQLGYLGFEVSDPSAWEDYATKVLGVEVSEKAEDGTLYLRFDEYHHRIAIHKGTADDVVYVGFQTANREEFEKTKAKLYEGGIEYAQASQEELKNRHVLDMVKYNMSGVRAEVYYGPHILFERPFQPSLPVTGFRTGDLGLGHVGLNPDDGGEFIRILTECLEFRPSDALGGTDERFFHCNPREHTVVVGRRPATPEAEANAKRIGHFMIELNSIDDVGHCLDRVEDLGIELTSRLGKHTNDHMISFYMKTPSGFRMEYGWNGRTIDDESKWQVNHYAKASIWGHRPPRVPAASS